MLLSAQGLEPTYDVARHRLQLMQPGQHDSLAQVGLRQSTCEESLLYGLDILVLSVPFESQSASFA